MAARILTALALTVILSACGGGGGSEPPTAPVTPQEPPPAARQELLAIGNSITYHDCVPAIGWCNYWGMAAPSAEQDYAHLVAKGINASNMSVHSIVKAEMEPATSDAIISQMAALVKPSSVVVIELGDNAKTNDLVAFRAMYGKLVAAAKKGSQVICTSTFWIRLDVDGVMYEECVSRGGKWVFIGDISPDPANPDRNSAPYPDPGVNVHPQAWGMARIAERIIKAAKTP